MSWGSGRLGVDVCLIKHIRFRRWPLFPFKFHYSHFKDDPSKPWVQLYYMEDRDEWLRRKPFDWRDYK